MGPPRGLERLELRIERLDVTIRFTFAFHARQVRLERDSGDGYVPLFPETFSFHRERHDPTELSLQLDDLLRKPELISPRAHLRDSHELVRRLLWEAPPLPRGRLHAARDPGRPRGPGPALGSTRTSRSCAS